MNLEKIILGNLLYNEKYARKALPFLKQEYFHNHTDRIIFNLIHEFVQKYSSFPTKEALIINLSDVATINQDVFKETAAKINDLSIDETTHLEWLLDETEQYCQDKAIHNALSTSINILSEQKGSSLSKGAIPQLLSDALAVSFDTQIGHDYIDDWESRFDSYHAVEKRIPFDIDLLNVITNGGFPPRTLNLIMAGTGAGKTRMMSSCAAANLRDGKNVLYITLEMGEKGDPSISQRIDANLLDVSIADLMIMHKDTFQKKIQRLKEKTTGKLIVKEYPTCTASIAHFRGLLNELKLKKNFVPDIVYVDYLNLCLSARLKSTASADPYIYIKSIAEELRGLAAEFNIPIVSATQLNRQGFASSDPEMTNTSESFGLPFTVDFMIALITSEELDNLNQIMVKQLKNRYTDPAFNRRFVIGVDRPKMRLYNVEQDDHKDNDDVAVMDNTEFMEKFEEEEPYFNKKFNKHDFKGFR